MSRVVQIGVIERLNAFIEISDNGVGISERNIKDIFSPFYTTKPVGQGTGLGLFICYRIVTEELSGAIDVRSSNEGTIFRITLPSAAKREDSTDNLLLQA